MISKSGKKVKQAPSPRKTNKSSFSKASTSGTSRERRNTSLAVLESNKRIAKAKAKKKTMNKTEPNISQEDLKKSLSSLRSNLSCQVYEMQYLNSLQEFNKRLHDLKKSFSLQGNQENKENYALGINQNYRDYPEWQNQGQNVPKDTSRSHNDHDGSPPLMYMGGIIKYHDSIINNAGNQRIVPQMISPQKESMQIKREHSEPNSNLTYQPSFKISEIIREQSSPSLLIDRKIKCNCTKNGCRQGYCECLKNGLSCDPSKCQCLECKNTVTNFDLRSEVKMKKTKVAPKEGCNCKNSQCLKNYCECYQSMRPCNPIFCKCKGCKNDDFNRLSQQTQFFAHKH